MFGQDRFSNHPMVANVACRLKEQPAFLNWLAGAPVPDDRVLAKFVVGCMLDFFLRRPGSGDEVPMSTPSELDTLAGVPGFSSALWSSGLFRKTDFPSRGVEVHGLSSWFAPDCLALLSALSTVYAVTELASAATVPRPVPPPTPAAPRARAGAAGGAGAFEAFWAAYPKKAKKKAAEASYLAAVKRGATHDVITAGLERCKASEQWRRDNGKFVPYPSTWLNADGWHDELPPAPGALPPEPTGDGEARANEARARREAEIERLKGLQRQKGA